MIDIVDVEEPVSELENSVLIFLKKLKLKFDYIILNKLITFNPTKITSKALTMN